MGGVAIAANSASDCARIAITASAGAASAATTQSTHDMADVAITNGFLGEHIKENVHDAKSSEEVFCIENGVRLVSASAIGAVVGSAWNGTATFYQPSQLTDDALANSRMLTSAVAVKVAMPKVLDKLPTMGGEIASCTVKKMRCHESSDDACGVTSPTYKGRNKKRRITNPSPRLFQRCALSQEGMIAELTTVTPDSTSYVVLWKMSFMSLMCVR